jgi:hypothetical protein
MTQYLQPGCRDFRPDAVTAQDCNNRLHDRDASNRSMASTRARMKPS